MRGEEVTEVYIKDDEIKEIVEKIKNLSFDSLKKKEHYYFSIAEKNTDEKLIKEYFEKFDIIKMIHYRKRPTGYNNYDLFYVMNDGTYIVYSINIEKQPAELINAFHVDRNFNRFKKLITKKY